MGFNRGEYESKEIILTLSGTFRSLKYENQPDSIS